MKKAEKKKKTKKIKYSTSNYEAPIGKVTFVENFLPPPEVLFANEDRIKITIEIEGTTLDFFKAQAEMTGSKYQRLMRQVLKYYAKKFSA